MGASINLMSMSIDNRLGLGQMKTTTIKLQLAGKSYIFLIGEIENVLVKVDKFILPANFMVIDIEEDKDVPLSWANRFCYEGGRVDHGGVYLVCGD